ncbi:MAG: polyprenyl synthetase family protein [Pseudomonadota bacterium]
MKAGEAIERALKDAVSKTRAPTCPPKLGKSLRYAVFPGGARIRPRLCLSIARACGRADEKLALSTAAALELMHCASLVHDDLPCFDDADLRRDKPSVHKAFGESTAILVGDALIILAFETLAEAFSRTPHRLADAICLLSQNAGVPMGIAAGQAWEAEDDIPLDTYHQAKTGALFAAATGLGAIVAGRDPKEWTTCGMLLGTAFQAIDDIRDVVGDPYRASKPMRQDARHERPNLALCVGAEAAEHNATDLVERALLAIPACPGRAHLIGMWRQQFQLLLPGTQTTSAAVQVA